MINRRKFTAGAASFPFALGAVRGFAQPSTPGASPVATPVPSTAPSTADILPAWQDAQDALRKKGEAVSDAFWGNDMAGIRESANQELAAVLSDLSTTDQVSMYTTNQIQFSIPELGAWFFGQYTPELISGFFQQGALLIWEVTPGEPQASDVPSGTWAGMIGEGIIDLGIILEFSGDADALKVTLTIPQQGIVAMPLSDVVVANEIPVGEKIDTAVLPVGGGVTSANLYNEQYAWGNHTLSFQTTWDEEGLLAGLTLYPQGTLPEVETPDPVIARLPFDGAWAAFWGGDTEFRNYHAVVPQQRYALDLMIWQDGSTAREPGRRTDHYYAFGQPYLAPVDGTVVAVLDGLEDVRPQGPGSDANTNPAGNHIVIETSGVYVFLAHCQSGSIRVQEGDTVSAGDVIALVGNSGNTSEPHVHIHAQTRPDLFDPEAIGVPMLFEGAMGNGESVDQLSVQQGTIVEHIP